MASISVFCGSSAGSDPLHRATAEELGATLAADGHRLVYVTRDRATRELDLRTGEVTLLASPPPGRGAFLLNPQKTHGTSNDPHFSPYDAEARVLAPSPRRAGCQAYFTRDGRFGFWTTRSGGPILRIDLARRASGRRSR